MTSYFDIKLFYDLHFSFANERSNKARGARAVHEQRRGLPCCRRVQRAYHTFTQEFAYTIL